MKRILLPPLFLLSAILIFQAGNRWLYAAENDENRAREIITHRTDAGEPDATGWSLAQSTEGGFSVMMPGQFDDFTVTGVAPDGVPIYSHIVKTRTSEGSNFSAFRVTRVDGTLPAGTVENIVEKHRKKSFFFKQDKISVMGLEGYEILAKNDQNSTAIRVFRDEARLYELIVEFSSNHSSEMEPQIRRFMESFTFQ